jgi:hypothetical protein
MHYFQLHRKDGTSEVICSRCRVVIGTVNGATGSGLGTPEIDAMHRCRVLTPPDRSTRTALRKRRRPMIRLIESQEMPQFNAGTNIPFAFLSVASFIYAVPTSLEFLANQYFNPWLAAIVFGDLLGCVWLAAIFKMRKTGLLLYLLLVVCKCCLCMLEVIPASTLFWITDLVPAVVVAGRIAWANGNLAERDLQG